MWGLRCGHSFPAAPVHEVWHFQYYWYLYALWFSVALPLSQTRCDQLRVFSELCRGTSVSLQGQRSWFKASWPVLITQSIHSKHVLLCSQNCGPDIVGFVLHLFVKFSYVFWNASLEEPRYATLLLPTSKKYWSTPQMEVWSFPKTLIKSGHIIVGIWGWGVFAVLGSFWALPVWLVSK